jgi:ribosomal protein L29
MKIAELKKKNTGELQTLLSEKKISLRNFRFAVAGSKTRNVKEGHALKIDIARINTILNEEK